MKAVSFLVLLFALSTQSAFSATISNIEDIETLDCSSSLSQALDLSAGKYMTEHELDFDGTSFTVVGVDQSNEGRIEYAVEFDGDYGSIDISTSCDSFNAYYGFATYENISI